MKWRKVDIKYLEDGIKLAMNEDLYKLVFKSSTREHKVVAWRHAVMMAYRLNGLTTVAIGKLMNRDHSTVVHAVRKYDDEVKGFGSDITDRLKQIHWYTFQRVPMVCNECDFKFKKL